MQNYILKSLEFMDQVLKENQKELDDEGKGGKASTYWGGDHVRTITHDERYIYLHQHHYNKFDYFTYTPELYSFLANPRNCSFSVNGDNRTQIDLVKYRKSGKNVSRWQIVLHTTTTSIVPRLA